MTYVEQDKLVLNAFWVNMRKDFYVYIYVDENNSAIYVGKGSSTRIDKHICYVKKKISRNQKMGTHFYNFLSKLIKQNIEPKRFICQPNLTEEEAMDLEKYLIKLFGRRDKKTGILLNHTDGGEGSSGLKWSEESRAKKRGDGHPLHNKGYLVTGEKNGFFGKHHSEEDKKRQSELMKKISIWKNHSTETRKRMGIAQKIRWIKFRQDKLQQKNNENL